MSTSVVMSAQVQAPARQALAPRQIQLFVDNVPMHGTPRVQINDLPDSALATILQRCLRHNDPAHLTSCTFFGLERSMLSKDKTQLDGNPAAPLCENAHSDLSARTRDPIEDVIVVLPAIAVCKRWRALVFSYNVITRVEACAPVGLPPSVQQLSTVLHDALLAPKVIEAFATSLAHGTQYTRSICHPHSTGLHQLRSFRVFTKSDCATHSSNEHAVTIMRTLATHLQRLTSLVCLDLSTPDPCFQLKSNGAKILATALHGLTNLEILDVSGHDIGPMGLSAIASALPPSVTMRRLNVSRNALERRGANALGRVIHEWARAAPPRFLLIRELDLSHNDIWNPKAPGNLMNTLWIVPGLERLHLEGNSVVGEAAEALGTAVARCQYLQVLNLRSCSLKFAGVSDLLVGLYRVRTLQTLDLSCNDIGDAGVECFECVLQHLPVLKHLNLADNAISSSGAAWLAKLLGDQGVACGLQILKLARNEIDDAGAGFVAAHLQKLKALRVLDLSLCEGISDSGRALVQRTLPELVRFDAADADADHYVWCPAPLWDDCTAAEA